MNRIAKLYRVSYPKIYTLMFNVMVPIIVLGIVLAAFSLFGSKIALSIAGALIPLTDAIGDYFSFNGILKKNYIFGVYMSSLSGRRTLKEQMVLDQVIRFLKLTLMFLLTGVIGMICGEMPGYLDSPATLMSVMLVMGFACYIVNSFLLSLLRIIDFFMLYCIISSVGGMIAGISLALLIGQDFVKTVPVWAFGVLTVVALIATFSIVSHVMHKFDKSFKSPAFIRDFESVENVEYFRSGQKKSESTGKMLFTEDGKKKFWIFLAIAYGVSYILGLLVIYAHKTQADASILILAQMAMPMCGVLLGKLVVDKNVKYPKAPMLIALGTGILNLIIGVYSIFGNVGGTVLGQASLTTAYFVNVFVTVLGSVALIISLLTAKSGYRRNLGMHNPKVLKSLLFVLLYVVAFLLRFVVLIIVSGIQTNEVFASLSAFFSLFTEGALWLNLLIVLVQAIIMYIPYLGEEYGWRYYLQPVLHNKFGTVWGTLILGCAWAVWHVFVDFFYYAPDSGLQMFASQFVTCTAIGIFLAYAYLKTKNIWMAALIHYLNNNMAVLFAGGQSNDALQNALLTWKDVGIQIIGMLPFLVFIVFLIINAKKDKNLSKDLVKVGE